MELKDEIIVCKDCGKEFTFTVRDQEFYKEKGYEHKPVRCRECRAKKKAERAEFEANKASKNNEE